MVLFARVHVVSRVARSRQTKHRLMWGPYSISHYLKATVSPTHLEREGWGSKHSIGSNLHPHCWYDYIPHTAPLNKRILQRRVNRFIWLLIKRDSRLVHGVPSDLIHQCSKRLLPSIHLYNADPRWLRSLYVFCHLLRLRSQPYNKGHKWHQWNKQCLPKRDNSILYLLNLETDHKPETREQASEHSLYWHQDKEDNHSRKGWWANRVHQQ